MLERGNTADPAATTRGLGRAPQSVASFVPADTADLRGLEARLGWLLPLLRASIALVWIVTGVVSAGLYPVEQSYALLARVGVADAWQPVLLYGAAAMDFVFGLATLMLRRRRLLWIAQMLVIVGYTEIISWRLPEFWLHPYGPLTKNLPMLAAIWLLYILEWRP
jgi:hypothetical protein